MRLIVSVEVLQASLNFPAASRDCRCDLTLMARMKAGMARLVRYASVSLSRRQTCQPKRFMGPLQETMSKDARTGRA